MFSSNGLDKNWCNVHKPVLFLFFSRTKYVNGSCSKINYMWWNLFLEFPESNAFFLQHHTQFILFSTVQHCSIIMQSCAYNAQHIHMYIHSHALYKRHLILKYIVSEIFLNVQVKVHIYGCLGKNMYFVTPPSTALACDLSFRKWPTINRGNRSDCEKTFEERCYSTCGLICGIVFNFLKKNRTAWILYNMVSCLEFV